MDTRDYPQSPKSGDWFRLISTTYKAHDLSGNLSQVNFNKYEVDFRSYQSLGSDNTLALEFYSGIIVGEKVPFTYLLSIGGNQKLRGFYAGRFLGTAMELLQVENRTEINSKWAWAQFFSQGRIANSISEIDSAKDLITAGIGLHYYIDPKNRTKLRLDSASPKRNLDFTLSLLKPSRYCKA